MSLGELAELLAPPFPLVDAVDVPWRTGQASAAGGRDAARSGARLASPWRRSAGPCITTDKYIDNGT